MTPSYSGDLLFGTLFRAFRSSDSAIGPYQVWDCYTARMRIFFLTKRGIYIFFSKFRFFSKEIFVKAFKFLVNFMFICYFFFTAERVWTWFNKSCCFFRLRKNFEYFSPNSHHLHLLLILTPVSFSSYICLSFFFFCSLYGCNHKYNLGFVLTLLIYFLMKQFWHVFFWLFLLKSE